MSESESDSDLTEERYDLENDLNVYGSPVYRSPKENPTSVEPTAVEAVPEENLAANETHVSICSPLLVV